MKKVTFRAAVILAVAWLTGCGQACAACGIASAFTPGSGAGTGPHNRINISAAHQSLPPGSRVVVRNQKSGRSIVARIAGRSESLLGQIIDLSADAMNALGMAAPSPVCVEVVSYGSGVRAFRRAAGNNPVAPVKQAGNPEPKNVPGVARLAHIRVHEKPGRAHKGGRRYAQARHRSRPGTRPGHRHFAARS